MSVKNFIPQLWVARLVAYLEKAYVYGQAGVCNRDYEGVINDVGDAVRISAIGPVTITDYVKTQDLPAPEELATAQTVLAITQGKTFNFMVNDVDAAQANVDIMDRAMERAASGLKDRADQYVASFHVEAHEDNLIGTDAAPIVPDANTAYQYLVDLGVLLDEKSVPADGRWCIVPPWFHGLLQKDNRFVSAANSGSTATLRNGEVGQAAGFSILKSNNVPNDSGTKYKIMAGHPMAITFVDHFNKVEAYRPERRFADAVKGLHLYGGKVIIPEALAVMTANKS